MVKRTKEMPGVVTDIRDRDSTNSLFHENFIFFQHLFNMTPGNGQEYNLFSRVPFSRFRCQKVRYKPYILR